MNTLTAIAALRAGIDRREPLACAMAHDCYFTWARGKGIEPEARQILTASVRASLIDGVEAVVLALEERLETPPDDDPRAVAFMLRGAIRHELLSHGPTLN